MRSIASRWLHRQLRIAIHPDRLCIGRVANERRDRIADPRVIPLRTGAWPWEAAILALRHVIDDFARPDVSARVSLSSHFVRYAVVPWRDEVNGMVEQVAFARHCFRSLYGPDAEHWEVRVSDDGYRRNAIASAVDREWVLGLEAVFRDCRISQVSIQPWFMTACNRHRADLKRFRSGCVAVIETGRAALGIFDRFGWHSLAVRRLDSADPATLAPVLSQELLSAGLAQLPEHLFVIQVAQNTTSLLRSRTRHWVTPRQARVPGLFQWQPDAIDPPERRP
jgi:hypothetical protein